MDKKWYRSWPVKVLLIAVSLGASAGLAVNAINIAEHESVVESVIEGDTSTYLDSKTFAKKMASDLGNIRANINYRNRFETDGKLDLKKDINAERYINGSESTLDAENGLTFSLGTILDAYKANFHESGYGIGPISVENESYNIFAFLKDKNNYVYMTEEELKNQIKSGELVFRGNAIDNYLEDAESAADDTSISASLSIVSDMKAGYDSNNGGEILYVEGPDDKRIYSQCWYWGYIQSNFQTTKGSTLVELANTSAYWNGHLEEACAITRDAVEDLGMMYQSYSEWQNAYSVGATNISYLYMDDESNTIVTNNTQYHDVKQLDQYIKQIEESGYLYCIFDDRDGKNVGQTSLVNIEDQSWQSMFSVDNGVFAAWVNTDFPVKDDYYTASRTYGTYYESVKNSMIACGFLFVLYIGSLIWLVVIAGRSDKDEKLYINGFDHWKTEVAALLVILVWYIPCFAGLDISFSFRGTDLNRVVMMGLATAVVFTDIMFLTGLLSLVRRMKGKTVWSNSLTRLACHYLKTGSVNVANFIKTVYNNLNSLWQMLVAYGLVVLVHWIAIFSNYSPSFWGFVVSVIIEAAVLVYLVRRVLGRETIRDGVKKIKEGELEYQIPTEKLSNDQKEIADNINAIGEGLDAAVEKSLKSERMKTELITNVSHDLKTPLTSIVNYVDLLKQADIDDPQIKHYIEVLEQKAQRLKVLTEDVVEASKVSSGAITLEKMDINMVEILQQTSGEFEEKFEAKHLQEMMQLPEEPVIIHVDGRRLYRVLENLYNNIAKYALPGSRVYVTLMKKEGRAELTLRNISEQPLNITPEELTERFIRGDVARTTEGSGLGLSIAKSLTEIQGGSFELYLDGDLFKVTVSFPIV